MKRTTALLCALILCLGLFASCGNESGFLSAPKPSKNYQPTYDILMADASDGMGFGGVEYDLYKRTLEDYQPIKSAEISFSGKTVQVNYGGGTPSYMGINYYPLYGYGSKDAGATLEIDPFGTVAGAQWTVESTVEEAVLTEDEYIKIARDFLATVVYDVDQFEVISSGEFESGWKPDGYFVRFCRYVDGVKTTELAEIEVTYDGQLSYYFSYMLNQIPKDTKNPFDMDEVKAKVEAYIAQKTENRKEQYDEVNCTYDYKLTMLADGNLAIICEVEIECVNYREGGSREITGGLIELVIQ